MTKNDLFCLVLTVSHVTNIICNVLLSENNYSIHSLTEIRYSKIVIIASYVRTGWFFLKLNVTLSWFPTLKPLLLHSDPVFIWLLCWPSSRKLSGWALKYFFSCFIFSGHALSFENVYRFFLFAMFAKTSRKKILATLNFSISRYMNRVACGKTRLLRTMCIYF